MQNINERSDDTILRLVNTTLYQPLLDKTENIRSLVDRLTYCLNSLITNFQILKNKYNVESVENIAELITETNALSVNLLSTLEYINSKFKSTLGQLNQIIDKSTVKKDAETLAKAIFCQKNLLEEKEYLLTMIKNLRKIQEYNKKFNRNNQSYRENILKAAETEEIITQLNSAKVITQNLLVDKEKNLLKGLEKTTEIISKFPEIKFN